VLEVANLSVTLIDGHVVMFACGGVYWALVYYENRRRDRLYGVPSLGQFDVVNEVFHGGDTDGVNKQFRYSY
jgi:hypothetical protein